MVDPDFDEDWYLQRYPDIGGAVASGKLASGWAHFDKHGREEGRLGGPIGDDEVWVDAQRKLKEPFAAQNGANFLSPQILNVTGVKPRRVLLTGSCLAHGLDFHHLNLDCVPVDYVLTGGEIGFKAPQPAADYDLHLIHITLRDVLPEVVLWSLAHEDVEAHERAFGECVKKLGRFIDAQAWPNRESGLLTFVLNFPTPQANPMGRLLPKFDLRNPQYFIARLNEEIERHCRSRESMYVLDIDGIYASFGRKFVQDDSVNWFSHSSFIPTPDRIATRVELVLPLGSYFVRGVAEVNAAVWNEVIAMYRTARQADAVKLVVVDLDDTLWNGVAAEMDHIDPFIVEGWPLGLAEALLYLKKRGVLIALLSKNDEARVTKIWDSVYGRRFPLSSFVVRKINWRPKPENMAEILTETAQLAKSVVYVDDHPAERAAIKAAFPDMRVLDGHHYYWRKTLLYAPETQVPFISAESSQRTEMIQAQQLRLEAVREAESNPGAKLDDGLEIQVEEINRTHKAHPRAFELLNKTNQFNTTGVRWTAEQIAQFYQDGGCCFIFTAKDRFTPYGVVGVVLTEGATIRQVVMSCRVINRGVEQTALAEIIAYIGAGGRVTADAIDTAANGPSRDLFQRLGFELVDGRWILQGSVTPPDHAVQCTFSVLPRAHVFEHYTPKRLRKDTDRRP